jgi:copper chaperone CopZ
MGCQGEGVAGMSCGGCVNNVRNALTRIPGVQE